MGLINIVKVINTAQPFKPKYFKDFIDAGFYIQLQSSKLHFTTEKYKTYFDGSVYFSVSRLKIEPTNDIKKLEPNCIHKLIKLIDVKDGRIFNYHTDEKKLPMKNYHPDQLTKINCCIDNNGVLYQVNDQVKIEEAEFELATIKPQVDEAITQALNRKSNEARQRLTFFNKHQAELDEQTKSMEKTKNKLSLKAKEIKKIKTELEKEAAKLESDGIDLTMGL